MDPTFFNRPEREAFQRGLHAWLVARRLQLPAFMGEGGGGPAYDAPEWWSATD